MSSRCVIIIFIHITTLTSVRLRAFIHAFFYSSFHRLPSPSHTRANFISGQCWLCRARLEGQLPIQDGAGEC